MSGVVEIEPRTDKLPEVYFDPPDKYWTRGRNGFWFKRGKADIKCALKDKGISNAVGRGYLSPLDETILEIQEANNIQYAGPLAGYAEGVHVYQGKRLLVTSGPQLVEPLKGEWPLMEGIFINMMGKDGIQLQHFYSWLKFSLETLRKRINNPDKPPVSFPGQTLALVGEKGAAKSLTQAIITELLGGRCARPYQAMLGGTSFNGDLFEAEHLCIEDESPSTDLRTRRKLGAGIKMATVNGSQRCERKYREALELNPFWRLTISVNDDPEHLMVLPPLDESLSDKIMLLKCRKHEMPMPAGTPAEKEAFWNALMPELPGFAYFLLNEWTVPGELTESRFGVKCYHHTDILEALSAQSPEQQLLDLIDMEIFSSDASGPETVRAIDVQKKLTRYESDCNTAATKLLSFPSATGTYLGRLSKSHPHRVEKGSPRDGTLYWVLNPPL